jgi:hypothetical protein
MYLINFLNENKNWKERLTNVPYCLDIKQDGEFYIFKYNMILSDLSLDICKEARGSIFVQEEDGWRCVCRSLDKFGNWGESYADTGKIDWSLPVSIQEKIDGSIIRCWCYKGLWHVSTNGTIDAFKAECGDSTYGDVFYSIIEKFTTIRNFFDCLDSHYTYWFELVHPQYNHIVVKYDEPAIYYLGCRNMVTMKECELSPTEIAYGVRTPRIYEYHSLNDVLEACHNMGADEEGYVVCAYNQMRNDSFLRIKCKGDEYLIRHKLRGNGPLTALKIVSLWQSDAIDDFLAYFPEHTEYTNQIVHKIIDLCEKAEIAYDVVKGTGPRKDFAFRAQTYIKSIQSYLFARLDKKVDNAFDFFKQAKTRNLVNLLEEPEIGLRR